MLSLCKDGWLDEWMDENAFEKYIRHSHIFVGAIFFCFVLFLIFFFFVFCVVFTFWFVLFHAN